MDPQNHFFELVSGDSGLCYQCHDEPAESEHANGPIVVGVCTACHNPHSAENLYGPNFTGDEVCFVHVTDMTVALETLVAGEAPAWPQRPAAPVTDSGTALDLGETDGMAAGSGPPISGEGGCVTTECHATTVSGKFVHGPTAQQQCLACHTLVDELNHRFEMFAPEPDLCFECHEQPEEAAFIHGPVALGLCTVCHDPHSAPNQFML
ncbi:MAG: cytochrome c3 family protein, partial [Planctomycetota bacterium]